MPTDAELADPEPWDASKSRPSPLGQIREFRRFATRAEAEAWGEIVEFSPRARLGTPVAASLPEGTTNE